MSKQLVGKAPLTQVRTASRGIAFIREGKPAPSDITDDDRKRLIKEGYLVEVDIAEPEDDAPNPGTAKAILAEVGTDKKLAQAALEEEQAKDEPRKGLVADLQKVIDS